MFVRQNLDTTLGDVATLLRERDEDSNVLRVEPDKIEFHLDAADPTIKVGDHEVPATDHALSSFGDLLQIPQAFLKRASGKVQNNTMSAFLNEMTRNTLLKDAKVNLRGEYLDSIDEWGKDGIKPLQVVNAVANVVTENAPLARFIDTPAFFGFDVYAPEGFAHGYGGEGVAPYADGNERDDITAGGFRVGLDMKHGLAPTANKWMYRLACTNGYEIEQAGTKIDARGQTVDEVIAELESLARLMFAEVEHDISAFYDLKQQRIENPERALRQISRERGIPDRSMTALMDLAVTDLPDEVSMFDIVNLVTNFANSPAVTRDGGRLILERAGGASVSDHAARCGHCMQRVR